MTTNNLMKYKKHLSAVMTFNYWIFFLISALLTGCSSSNDDKAHPTNPVECCADANPKTMLPNDT